MEAIVVAAISALGAVAVALINARATRQHYRPAPTTPESPSEAVDDHDLPGAPERAWRRLWALFGRLPPIGRRTTPWVAALLGFLFSGLGVALYFRKGADVLVGVVFLLPLLAATSGSGEDTTVAPWYWPFATLTATYCVLRAESANRRLEAVEPASD